MFHNTTWVRQSESKNIKDALYDISGTLKSYKSDHSGIWVYTTPGDQERGRREAQFIEDAQEREQFLREIGLIRDEPEEDEPDETD